MNIRVLSIELPAVASEPEARFDVRVELDLGGESHWFTFHVSPLGMPGSRSRVIEAGRDFRERFREQRKTDRHVRRLVGQAVRHGKVHLPQLIAA